MGPCRPASRGPAGPPTTGPSFSKNRNTPPKQDNPTRPNKKNQEQGSHIAAVPPALPPRRNKDKPKESTSPAPGGPLRLRRYKVNDHRKATNLVPNVTKVTDQDP